MDGCMDGWVGGWMNSKLWSLILWLYVLELFFLWRLDLCRFAVSLGPGLGLLSLCTVSSSIHQLRTRHLPLLALHIPSGRIHLCPSSSWHFLHEGLQPNPSSKLLTHTPKRLLLTWTSQGSPKSTCPGENSLFSPQTHSYSRIFPSRGVNFGNIMLVKEVFHKRPRTLIDDSTYMKFPKTGKFIEMENRLVVARIWWLEGVGCDS